MTTRPDSRQVWKYEVPIDRMVHKFELFGPVVHVASQRDNFVTFWVDSHPQWPVEVHKYRVVGTGSHQTPENGDHVGSTIDAGGYVWHLFEVFGPDEVPA